MIAALYVDPRGPYFGRPDVDPWDETRDARLYNGPHPVVAHPPCGPWGMFAHMCTKQDRTCGPAAVEVVRRLGGVLEHPRYSRLFNHCRLPLPGEFSDTYGGRTYELNQVSWGHCLAKPTWLYAVGVSHATLSDGIKRGGRPTHRMTSGPQSRGYRGLPMASAFQRRATPPAFADWLISLAESVERRSE